MSAVESPLSKDLIERGLIAFARDPATPDKLAWWLLFAHSSERWLQFEFAYALDILTRDRFHVACEQERADIVFYPRPVPFPLWKNTPAAKMELNWCGNGYADCKTFRDIAADVRKVDQYEVPSLAIAVWFLTRADDSAPEYAWIEEQTRRKGVSDAADIIGRLSRACGRGEEDWRPDFRITVPVAAPGGFVLLEFLAFSFWNASAKAAVALTGQPVAAD